MKTRTETDEYLELIWYMRENGSDRFATFRREVGAQFDENLIVELESQGLVARTDPDPVPGLQGQEGTTIALTESGIAYTRQLIRSHRLAERLVHDVLGVPYEEGACEFEHILNADLVDSICTLLGHPRECPHGMPIPEGECCRQRTQTVESSVLPVTELAVGESARIAYVNTDTDLKLHKLENLLLVPGNTVRLHQRSPSVVIECENSIIALDDAVAEAIQVWATGPQKIHPHGRRGSRRGFRHGVHRRS